jgi:hypothetical protein
MDRRADGPQSRCGSLYRKEYSLASAKIRTPDRLAIAYWLYLLGCSRKKQKSSSVFEPRMMARSGLLCGSDYRGYTVGSFGRGHFFYLTDVAFDFSSRLWAVGSVDYVNSVRELMGSDERYVLHITIP